MMQCNGDKPCQTQPEHPLPKVDQGGGHEHCEAREGGERVFAERAEKRAKEKHRQEKLIKLSRSIAVRTQRAQRIRRPTLPAGQK